MISALRLIGYDYVISIEHEDALMSADEGLAKGVALLKEAGTMEVSGAMFWAQKLWRDMLGIGKYYG